MSNYCPHATSTYCRKCDRVLIYGEDLGPVLMEIRRSEIPDSVLIDALRAHVQFAPDFPPDVELGEHESNCPLCHCREVAQETANSRFRDEHARFAAALEHLYDTPTYRRYAPEVRRDLDRAAKATA